MKKKAGWKPLTYSQKNPTATLMIMHGNSLVNLAFLIVLIGNGGTAYFDTEADWLAAECEFLELPPQLLFGSRIVGLVGPLLGLLLTKACPISEDLQFINRVMYFVAGPLAWVTWSSVFQSLYEAINEKPQCIDGNEKLFTYLILEIVS